MSAAPGGTKSSTRRYVIVGLVALLLVSGAAFGVGALISTGRSTTSTAPPFPGRSSQAFQAFQNCLSQHGVTQPSAPPAGAGGSSGGGAPPSGGGFSPAARKAFAACASLLPSGGPSIGAGFPGG